MQPLTKVPASQEFAEIVTLTPDKAHELLAGNTHNRNIRERHVNVLARDMAAGRWYLSGDAIKIASDGTILDGQHRLLAVIASEATIQTIVVFNVSQEAQIVMDTGIPRTFPDILRLRGETHVNDKAALTRKIALWETDGLRAAGQMFSRQELLDLYLSRKDAIDETVLFAGRIYIRHEITIPRSTLGLAIYNLMQVDVDDAFNFFERLSDGQDMSEGDPIYALRRTLRNRTNTSSAGLNSYQAMGLIYKAWNAYRTGEIVQQMTFRTGGRSPEQIPTPV